MNARPPARPPQCLTPRWIGGGAGGADIPKMGSQTQLILCPMALISDMPGGLTLHNMNTKPKPELKEYHEKWQTGHKLS